MNYLYSRVENDASFALDTPERRAFKAHLVKVAKALHDIEWVDSGDCAPGSESEAIRACISNAAVLEAAAQHAETALQELRVELERVKEGK
jgi:hypothetical protein